MVALYSVQQEQNVECLVNSTIPLILKGHGSKCQFLPQRHKKHPTKDQVSQNVKANQRDQSWLKIQAKPFSYSLPQPQQEKRREERLEVRFLLFSKHKIHCSLSPQG